MRILLLHVKRIWYRVGRMSYGKDESLIGRTWEGENIPVALIHVEEKDVENSKKIVERAFRVLSWYARKVKANKIVLHSFAHLSDDKASPEKAEKILNAIAEKMRGKGYDVHVTPFGYFLELLLHITDEPISRVYQEF